VSSILHFSEFPIYRKSYARDKPGLVRNELQGRIRAFFRRAQPTDGMSLLKLVPNGLQIGYTLRKLAKHGRIDNAGTKHIHPNIHGGVVKR